MIKSLCVEASQNEYQYKYVMWLFHLFFKSVMCFLLHYFQSSVLNKLKINVLLVNAFGPLLLINKNKPLYGMILYSIH